MKRVLICLGALMAATSSPASAQGLQKLSIVVFGSPSLGAFLPPIIKAQKLDERNGLSISFEERTPDAYTAQFNSGEFQLGGSAAVLTVGLADVRGVKVTYLFNLFDYWGTVVTSRPEVNSLRDIEGKDLAAACKHAGVKVVCIPQRGGKRTGRREAYEKSAVFKNGQRFRAGIEGRISVLFRGRGMKRCLAEGRDRFELWVGAAVLANNLMRIAAMLGARSPRRQKAA